MEIILDTNFIVECVKRKIDLFSYVKENFSKVLIPEGVIVELKKMAESRSSDGLAAEFALKLVEGAEIVGGKDYVDELILDYVKNHKGIVVGSLDGKLLKLLGVRAKQLVIQSQKKLVVL